MARSSWKFTFISSHIYKNVFFSKFKNIKLNKIFSRNSFIPNFFLRKNIFIHKGNIFNKVTINKYYLGYKFGEFSFTRKPFSFPLKNLKKNKR